MGPFPYVSYRFNEPPHAVVPRRYQLSRYNEHKGVAFVREMTRG